MASRNTKPNPSCWLAETNISALASASKFAPSETWPGRCTRSAMPAAASGLAAPHPRRVRRRRSSKCAFGRCAALQRLDELERRLARDHASDRHHDEGIVGDAELARALPSRAAAARCRAGISSGVAPHAVEGLDMLAGCCATDRPIGPRAQKIRDRRAQPRVPVRRARLARVIEIAAMHREHIRDAIERARADARPVPTEPRNAC